MVLALLLCAPIAVLLLAGIIYQVIGTARDTRRFPPPGHLIDAGGFRLHLQESGASDRPVVVLESGIAASSLSWSRVAEEVGKFARVVRYDRAGLGWSDRASTPRAAAQCAQELRRLLENAGVRGPFVLVGHSFGGYVARVFASQFPKEVAGLVLVDNPSTSEWTQLSRDAQRKLQGGALFSRIGAVLAWLGVVRFCLARLSSGSANLPVMVTRTFGRNALTVVGRLVGEVQKLPPELWPQVQAQWSQPKAFHSMANHLNCLPQSAAQVEAFSLPTNIPLLVLTARQPDPAHNLHALRIVEDFELRYAAFRGLNLTFEVREGIIKHSHDYSANQFPELAEYLLDQRPPLEAQLIDLADEIAYDTADLDDGYEARLLTLPQIRSGVPVFDRFYREAEQAYPAAMEKLKFNEALKRILDRMVGDLIRNLQKKIKDAGVRSVDEVRACPRRLATFSPEVEEDRRVTKEFLYKNLYFSAALDPEKDDAERVVRQLFELWMMKPEALPQSYQEKAAQEPLARVVCDYIAGMTDHFIYEQYEKHCTG